ncbi:IucC family-domain-containing protein [Cyathus striatus]|nr:IucC family-domain-containing protein [Cyathus striatus]
MSTGCALPPDLHATFSVVSRLISCLVTEELLRAIYIPTLGAEHVAGMLVVLSTHVISEQPIIERTLHCEDVLVIVPLHHSPVFRDESVNRHGRHVALVDPLDMLPVAYEFQPAPGKAEFTDEMQDVLLKCFVPPAWEIGTQWMLTEVTDAVALFRRFVHGVVMQDNLRDTIEKELSSSAEWQLSAFLNPPRCPVLKAPPIEWEQSLVSGHPTHPMHRARMFPGTLPENFNWYRPQIRFIRVPRSSLDIIGPFEDLLRPLIEKAVSDSKHTFKWDKSTVIMPVHEVQVDNIIKQFKDVMPLPSEISVLALAQSSIRTLAVPDLPGLSLKLSVGVKISSALRTISHFTANFGPRFSSEVVPHLSINKELLKVELEPASAIYRLGLPDEVKHFTAVLRAEYQPVETESIIVCAALFEMGHAGAPKSVAAVQHVFGLDTDEKRLAFLDRYIELACKALLPPLVENGVAFEAHAQNILCRVDNRTGDLLGFVVRDLGGLRIHPPTLQKSTGIEFEFLLGHCIVTETLQETYPKFYHTFVHNHIQRLIRLLGLHYDGRGWELLRRHMGFVIPQEHELCKIWLCPSNQTVPSKCLMRMRMRDSYSEMVYKPFPNMIQYKPPTISEAVECNAI